MGVIILMDFIDIFLEDWRMWLIVFILFICIIYYFIVYRDMFVDIYELIKLGGYDVRSFKNGESNVIYGCLKKHDRKTLGIASSEECLMFSCKFKSGRSRKTVLDISDGCRCVIENNGTIMMDPEGAKKDVICIFSVDYYYLKNFNNPIIRFMDRKNIIQKMVKDFTILDNTSVISPYKIRDNILQTQDGNYKCLDVGYLDKIEKILDTVPFIPFDIEEHRFTEGDEVTVISRGSDRNFIDSNREKVRIFKGSPRQVIIRNFLFLFLPFVLVLLGILSALILLII